MLAGACGASDGAGEQARVGAELYETRCASCHELDAAIGTRLEPATLRSHGSARALYEYTRFAMPYEAPRSLAEPEYWAVTAHMLRSRGLLDADRSLGPHNADSITWTLVEP